ncbi:magnesium/cobalt transporter CorA [Dehalobacterium formicoaceticum]|uniref:Magnesium transport protein CorA n=1 Tax=Dehalobacterium formicoaceticum TaxID=51515 RepID=A0ABT1XZ69_9FIRM|nr:magnesium/cobalt transporter CorA [Dehalobacterium formicoaceticum]
MQVLRYREGAYHEEEISVESISSRTSFNEDYDVTWIRVTGLGDTALLEQLGEKFHIHMLALEGIVNTMQRPKFEDYGAYFFVVLKSIHSWEQEENIPISQVSMLVGEKIVITFEEKEEFFFHAVWERVVSNKGLIRKKKADFLAYSLVDAIVDSYFSVLEKLGEELEQLEERLIYDPDKEAIHAIHRMKRQMLQLRRALWPLREVIGNMERGVTSLIHSTTTVYLRDVYDHVIDMLDVIENYREMLSGMLDIYLSSVSNRMNEIMKVLTVISTIFIPLTFITSLYGMNFIFMPELKYQWAYPAVLGVMLLISLAMILFFWRKKWL